MNLNLVLGIMSIIFGLALIGLGMMFFMDRGLLALGNGVFLFGFICITGPKKAYYLLKDRSTISWKELACLICGIILVFIKYPISGLILQTFVFLIIIGRSKTMVLLKRIKTILLSF